MTRFVVCLDGTWNNAAKETERADGSRVYRPTNVLKVARATRRTADDGRPQVTYYDAGVGAMNRAPSGAARVLRKVDNVLGGALGAGFEVNIEEAYTFLANNWTQGDELFVFGFSRGAAQARSLCELIRAIGGFPAKRDAYYVPTLFGDHLASFGRGSGAERWEALNARRRESGRSLLAPLVPARIRFLGVWDTVLALGSRFKKRGEATEAAVAFHAPASPPANVDRVRHAIAIDERRHDFQPEIFDPAQGAHDDLEQRWFAGVHSNVGGGLVEDGLANCALHWMVEEAKAVGLDLDDDFLKFYRRFAAGRASTKSLGFRAMDTVFRPLRGFAGERDLTRVPGMTLDPSVITRLHAEASEFDSMDARYRPANLLRYLKAHPELHDQLKDDVRAAALAA